ncbi:MAG: MalY/PatB family protein [Clostridium sp.]
MKMKYDFTTVLDRTNTGSIKWNMMKEKKADVSKGVIPYSVADMEFKNPPEIIEGLKTYLDTYILGYQTAEPAFYQAVNGWTSRRYHWETKPEWLYTTPGVVNAFYNGVRAFSKKGEGVIVMTPVYYPFYGAIKKSGREIVKCPLLAVDGHYEMDFKRFEKLAKKSSNTLLLFCNPHNPTGRVWTREELKKLGDICLKYGIFIISDEIHCDIIMPGHEFTSFATVSKELEHHMMTCIAPSKTFNLAGLETACVIMENSKQFEKLKVKMGQNAQEGRVNALGYRACEIAYTQCDEWLDELIQVIYENHLVLKDFMEEHCPRVVVGELEGTYLQWMDFRSYKWSRNEQERIMTEEAELFFDEGSLFGPEGEGFERMNLACPKSVMMEGLLRLEKVLTAE